MVTETTYCVLNVCYNMHWSDWVGQIGVLLLMTAFFCLQTGKIDAKGLVYSLANLGVAIFLGINLYYKPILANIILEAFWAVMSIYGIIRWYKGRK